MGSYKLTDTKYRRIANLAVQENGERAVRDYVSLMLNLFELYGSKYEDLYDYCLNSGWFYKPSKYMFEDQASKSAIAATKELIEDETKRTLPRYIDEHDAISDIKSCDNNGNYFDPYDRSMYKSGITKVKNKMGSTYTFVKFFVPENIGDPMGYTKYAYDKFGSSGGVTTTPVTPMTITTLKKGDENAKVAMVQTMLHALGYLTGGIDGIFGSATEQAIKVFQATIGMEASGHFGVNTRHKLIEAYKNVLGLGIATSRNTAYKGTYAINASSLNLRDGAGTQGTKVITAMKNGSTVTSKGYYTNVDGTDWLYVLYKDSNKKQYSGFASMEYLARKGG